MGQKDMPEVQPILEVNPDHQILQALKNSDDDTFLEDVSYLLLDQALLVENVPIREPSEFVRRLNRVLERTV
jgi:molecular chaperone HtpG